MKQTREIWKKHIQRIKDSDLDFDIEENEIMKFAQEEWENNEEEPTRRWNGRQIKNAFQTAIALARWDFYKENDASKPKRLLVKLEHFEHVAAIAAHFDDYVNELHGIHGEDTWGTLAERDGLRKDLIQYRNGSEQLDRDRRRRGSRSHVNRRGKDESHSFGGKHGDDSDELADTELDSDDESDYVRKLKAKLKRAKKKQKGKNKTPWGG